MARRAVARRVYRRYRGKGFFSGIRKRASRAISAVKKNPFGTLRKVAHRALKANPTYRAADLAYRGTKAALKGKKALKSFARKEVGLKR